MTLEDKVTIVQKSATDWDPTEDEVALANASVLNAIYNEIDKNVLLINTCIWQRCMGNFRDIKWRNVHSKDFASPACDYTEFENLKMQEDETFLSKVKTSKFFLNIYIDIEDFVFMCLMISKNLPQSF